MEWKRREMTLASDSRRALEGSAWGFFHLKAFCHQAPLLFLLAFLLATVPECLVACFRVCWHALSANDYYYYYFPLIYLCLYRCNLHLLLFGFLRLLCLIFVVLCLLSCFVCITPICSKCILLFCLLHYHQTFSLM